MDDDGVISWAITGLIGGLAFVCEIGFSIGIGTIALGAYVLFGGDDE